MPYKQAYALSSYALTYVALRHLTSHVLVLRGLFDVNVQHLVLGCPLFRAKYYTPDITTNDNLLEHATENPLDDSGKNPLDK